MAWGCCSERKKVSKEMAGKSLSGQARLSMMKTIMTPLHGQPERISTFYVEIQDMVEHEGSRYGRLVVAYHDKQRERNMDGLALQVSNAIMQETYPSEALTKFICNIEARVFACMQTAPPQELNDNYGLPPGGRPDV